MDDGDLGVEADDDEVEDEDDPDLDDLDLEEFDLVVDGREFVRKLEGGGADIGRKEPG